MTKTPFLFAAALSVCGFAMIGAASAESVDCNAAVTRVKFDLDALHLPTPAKPTQVFVGKNGIEYTGAEVVFMKHELAAAKDACRRGETTLSMTDLEKVYAKVKPQGDERAFAKLKTQE